MTFDPPSAGGSTVEDAKGLRRVLVVDDSVAAAKMLQLLLGAIGGYDVRIAHDGPQALTAAADFLPETVLLDIGLPGMDGYEVARKLREAHGNEILIVALTGYSEEEDKRRAYEHGCNIHAVKPLSLDQIQAILQQSS